MTTSGPPSNASRDAVDAAQLAAMEAQAPLMPFGGVCGVTLFGVPAFSNGDEDHYSGEPSLANDYCTKAAARCGSQRGTAGAALGDVAALYYQLGVKWQCVEFARRFLLMSKGLAVADACRTTCDTRSVEPQVAVRLRT